MKLKKIVTLGRLKEILTAFVKYGNLFEDPVVLARNSLCTTVKQLFEVGFFHAAPHPGNVIISNGDKMNDDP